MQVYKFGGASVRDAQGVRNLARIVGEQKEDLLIVVSAMGKTTNALERYATAVWRGQQQEAAAEWEALCAFHTDMVDRLGVPRQEIEPLLKQNHAVEQPYDAFYDSVVSVGERLSSRIVAAYLCRQGWPVQWWDMTHLLRTDATWREANVDTTVSAQQVVAAWKDIKGRKMVVAQGFIGGTVQGHATTLGREGSDYSAALLGNLLDAESVTIWKDVPGILNADPRIVADTIKIDTLRYQDAVELAYSGAQVIHPKTIRPLANKHIPLWVRPFMDPTAAGTRIDHTAEPVQVPVYIWRHHQVLITMRAKDFSFALEESLSDIFDIIHQCRLKVSLIQSSAVTISVCVDACDRVADAIAMLQTSYSVTWNEGLELLTIRGTTPEILQREQQGRTILLSQTTRRTARLVIQQP